MQLVSIGRQRNRIGNKQFPVYVYLSETAQETFIRSIAPMAMQAMIEYGVPASITIAQAILESGWGKSKLTREANNYFGIKADKKWTGPKYTIKTGEYDSKGNYYTVLDNFRKYSSIQAGFDDHAKFLRDNKRYANLFQSIEFPYWAYGLQTAKYSTSPTYAITLIGLINKYGLAQYDKQALNMESTTQGGKRFIRRYKTPLLITGFALLAAGSYYSYNHYKKAA